MIDINKMIVSNEFPLGKEDFNYFIGYKDSEEIRLLCTFHPQMTMYKKKLM